MTKCSHKSVKLSPISQFENLQGVKVKVTSVHMLIQKNTNRFFVFQDSGIPDV